jgi:CRP-like cAMP-binding protein
MAVHDAPSIISILRSSTLLNSVSAEYLDVLAQQSHAAFVERGGIIWLHGADTDFFGIVGTGFVKMVRGNSMGHEITTEIMGPGQVFGLLGTVEGTGCPLSARAVSECWYLKVPKQAFMPVYQNTTPLRDLLVRSTTNRLRHAYEMMARMSSGRVEERIAAILLILAGSYGRKEERGTLVDVPLTRQDIAEMAGTTVESAIRTLSRWQKDGLVLTESRRVLISDESKLEAMLQ